MNAAPKPVPLTGDAAVAYEVDLQRAHTQRVSVVATSVSRGQGQTWMMPVWTPGSYLVREFARHVQDVVAVDGEGHRLPVAKTAKNRWTVDVPEGTAVTLSYTLYANERSVRTNHVTAEAAVLNGAPTFLVPVDAMAEPLDVRFVLPEGWTSTETGLGAHPDGDAHRYVAMDYDELVDSPVVAGTPEVVDFEVRGVPHRFVNLGAHGVWTMDTVRDEVEAITEAVVDFWGDVPYERYVYLNVVADDAGGGLEHLDSTLMMARRDAFEDEASWGRWLGLVSHEFFHTWNVKRMRPVGLGPFDYEREVHTPSLWVAEGITSYYDDLLLVRAGVIAPDEHLARLSATISNVQDRPGRAVQPLKDASFDAWIKHYRPDENSVNTAVSYYRKGALVAWLLDAEIRRATRDKASLDDVMRRLYEASKAEGYQGFTPEDVRAEASRVAGVDLTPFFEATVDGTEELPYARALSWWGLRFPEPQAHDADGASDDADAWIGLALSGRTVSRVLVGTPAFEAGVIVGDEVLALDDDVVDGNWHALVKRRAPGDAATLLVGRDGRLRRVPITFGEAPEVRWRLSVDPVSTTTQRIRRDRWWQAPKEG